MDYISLLFVPEPRQQVKIHAIFSVPFSNSMSQKQSSIFTGMRAEKEKIEQKKIWGNRGTMKKKTHTHTQRSARIRKRAYHKNAMHIKVGSMAMMVSNASV